MSPIPGTIANSSGVAIAICLTVKNPWALSASAVLGPTPSNSVRDNSPSSSDSECSAVCKTESLAEGLRTDGTASASEDASCNEASVSSCSDSTSDCSASPATTSLNILAVIRSFNSELDSDSLLISIRQPVSFAAKRTFCPFRPIAKDNWSSGTMTCARFSFSSIIITLVTFAG